MLCSTLSLSSGRTMDDINHIRKEFNLALTNEEKAIKLFHNLSELNPATNTLYYAYWGATEALLAKHAFNPLYKLNYVKGALSKLNKAIEINKNNIEIRYMRFSVESNLPVYLGYSTHISDDKETILKELAVKEISAINCEMIHILATGLLSSNVCNKAEKKLLSKVITACNEAKLK